MLEYWKRTTSPRNVERFDAAVAAGRMSACAMAWNFTPMLGVRQFLHSLAPLPTLRNEHGLPLEVALNHDVNGLPWTMVPLLLDAGVKMVQMGINVHFGGFPLQRPLFFKWVGPSSTPRITRTTSLCSRSHTTRSGTTTRPTHTRTK